MSISIRLGRSRRGTELVWDGTPNAHLYASGQSGRGKSFFLKHCIAQLPQQGVRCIVFDYSGDFQQNASGWASQRLRAPCKCLADCGQLCDTGRVWVLWRIRSPTGTCQSR